MTLACVGSNPAAPAITYANMYTLFCIGVSPSGLRHLTLTQAFEGSNPSTPAIVQPHKIFFAFIIDFDNKKVYYFLYDPLAQLVEHLTFNQVVMRSSRIWVTIFYAVMAELADALDLGSSGRPWGFESL